MLLFVPLLLAGGVLLAVLVLQLHAYLTYGPLRLLQPRKNWVWQLVRAWRKFVYAVHRMQRRQLAKRLQGKNPYPRVVGFVYDGQVLVSPSKYSVLQAAGVMGGRVTSVALAEGHEKVGELLLAALRESRSYGAESMGAEDNARMQGAESVRRFYYAAKVSSKEFHKRAIPFYVTHFKPGEWVVASRADDPKKRVHNKYVSEKVTTANASQVGKALESVIAKGVTSQQCKYLYFDVYLVLPPMKVADLD